MHGNCNDLVVDAEVGVHGLREARDQHVAEGELCVAAIDPFGAGVFLLGAGTE